MYYFLKHAARVSVTTLTDLSGARADARAGTCACASDR